MKLIDRLLDYVETDLFSDLGHLDKWRSLDVDYEPPRVERLWRDVPEWDARVYVHRIHPCEKALYHPHPWPSAVFIAEGQYEMGVGFGSGDEEPPVATRALLTTGSYYEMEHPDGWHWVRPIGGPSLSVMITGQRWKRWSPAPVEKLAELSPAACAKLADDMRNAFSSLKHPHRGV